MKILHVILAGSFMFSALPVCAEDTEEKSQEYYDQQIEENMKQITAQMQTMSSEMTKYMNAMTKYMNESMPKVSNDMGKMFSSIRPLAETMQKNMQAFTDQINAELDAAQKDKTTTEVLVIEPVKPELASSEIIAPEDVKIPEPPTTELDSAIDAELAQFNQENPVKIKLFPSSVE